jgi:DNA-binding beta-propeller fold protein YncE
MHHALLRMLTGVLFASASLASHAAANAGGAVLARLSTVATLPGAGFGWGFPALDPARPYIWLPRRENGLTIVDVSKRQLVRTLAGSTGANAVAFVPGADRAYVANTDGTLGVLRLSDMTTLKRLPVSDANLNSVLFEPVTGKVFVSSGRRAATSTIYVLDPATDTIVASSDFAIRKIDPPLAPGDGTLLIPMRDEGKILRVQASTLAVVSTWSYPACRQPSALALDHAQYRLFIACRGDQPVLTVANLDTGALVATAPVGHAVNALAYDGTRHLVLAPSGADASITLLRQDDADHYTPLGTVATRSWGHNMAYDARAGIAYVLAMDVTQPPPQAGVRQDPVFHPDTFTVLGVQME